MKKWQADVAIGLHKNLESAVGIGELIGFGIGFTLSVYGDGSDLLLLHRTVIAAGAGSCDGIHHFHAGSDLAKGSILAIQVLGILMHNEELATGGVGAGGTGHAQNAPLVTQFVLEAVKEKLALDAVAGAAHTGAIGTAALDHKAGDDPVEDQSVIVIMICQINEVVHALGCLIGIQFALNDTTVFHSDLKSRVCHYQYLSFIARSIWRFASFSAAACLLS